MSLPGWDRLLRSCAVWAAIALAAACGSLATNPDATHSDAPGVPDADPADARCDGCVATGDVCGLASECQTGDCECSDATCSAKVCSDTACACQYTTDGTGGCDGDLDAGVNDATNSCGAGSACDGTGACGLPLLWFTFDDAPTATVPANRGTWPGTIPAASGTFGVDGVRGTAFQLADPGDGLAIPTPPDNSLDGFTAWTAEGWFNFAALPVDGYATLVKKDNAYICRIAEGAGCPGCYAGSEIVWAPTQRIATWTVPASASLSLGTWYHIACVFDGASVRLYWNGTQVATGPGGPGAMANSASDLGIGNTPAGTSEALDGVLDDFKMWTTARDARQICIDACGTPVGASCSFDGVCGN